MKKTALTSVMATMVMTTGVALAGEADTSLTTKNYVDSGLRAVYQTASGAASAASSNATAITNLQTSVNSNATAISGLQSQISSMQEAGYGADTSALQEAIETNAAAISSNAEDIAANALAISANSTAISEETTRAQGVEEGLASRLGTAEGDIAALQSAVNDIDSAAYSGVNGVTINNHNVGLSVTAEDGNMYIYTSSGWAPLPIEDTWNSDVLTSGSY